MNVLWYILIGGVVGAIARLILPGKENMGIIMTIVLGAVGSFLAGLIGQWLGWYTFPSWIGIVAAIVVSVILIAIYVKIKGRR
jgi:uncharacterized membrane protein YeaQ/YmgE (transglycosylase-associated protein family)